MNKDIIERLKNLKKRVPDCNVIDEIFPELKEEADEKIRKRLLELFKTKGHQIIDKPDEDFSSEDVICWLVEQEKSSPKFKIDDWISWGTGKAHIIDMDEDMYYFERGRAEKQYKVDKECSLWTIQDAVDGEILVGNDSVGTIIYSGYDDFGVNSYCRFDGTYFICDPEDSWEISIFKPATRDQTEMFLDRMRKSGYSWDPRKKTISRTDLKKKAEEYSFFIKSDLFNQLTEEQRGLWKKDIESAFINGARQKENLE